MKTKNLNSNTHAQDNKSIKLAAEQATLYEEIKLGIDWHADHYRVSRMIDGTPPQPAQRFTPEAFLAFAQAQCRLAKKIYSCYEAGPGAYVLHRQLSQLGIKNYVIHPFDLDRQHKGVATDKTDSHNLALNLDRFLHGNDQAICPVYVPTPEEEQRRALARQREQLRRERHRLATIGRSLLLTQGWRQNTRWWKPRGWNTLAVQLPGWLQEQLERWRALIEAVEKQLKESTAKVEALAPQNRPVGLGPLTLAALLAEVCRWERFKTSRAVGGYTGLCGGVSSSGPHHLDLSITKAGNARLRRLLVELAWRMTIYQPEYKPVKKWRTVLWGVRTHARRKKQIIVALGRQLAVDLWRWQTGQITPQKLGWAMNS